MADVKYPKYILPTGCINMLIYVLVYPAFLIHFSCDNHRKEVIILFAEFLFSRTKPNWDKHKTTDG